MIHSKANVVLFFTEQNCIGFYCFNLQMSSSSSTHAEKIARLQRAKHQRILLLDSQSEIKENEQVQTYNVMGNSNQNYRVRIRHSMNISDWVGDHKADSRVQWQCTCMDFCQRHQPCKHIYFVALNVLRLTDQEILSLSSEVVHTHIQERETRLRNHLSDVHDTESSSVTSTSAQVAQRPWHNQECVICMENMAPQDDVVYCRQSCGNNVHSICISRVLQHTGRIVCPFCRAIWQ